MQDRLSAVVQKLAIVVAFTLAIRVVGVLGMDGLGHVRSLFQAYATEYGPLVEVIFDVQGFDAEVAKRL